MKKKFTPIILSGLIASSALANPANSPFITTEAIYQTFHTFQWQNYIYPQEFKARFLACVQTTDDAQYDMYDLGVCCKSSNSFDNELKKKSIAPKYASDSLCPDFLEAIQENQNKLHEKITKTGIAASGQTSKCALFSGKPCLPDDLAKNKHAITGKYICKNKTTDTISCAATECEPGYYLQRNAKGESMGWCAASESDANYADAIPVPDEVGVAVPKETDEQRYERLKRENELARLKLEQEEARREQEERIKKQNEKKAKKDKREKEKNDLEAEKKAAKAQGLTLQQYRKKQQEEKQRQQRIQELQQQ